MSGMSVNQVNTLGLITSVGDGSPQGTKVDAIAALVAAMTARGGILDGDLRTQMKKMQQRNDWLERANAAVAAIRAARPAGDVDSTLLCEDVVFTDPTDPTKTINAYIFLIENGIKVGFNDAVMNQIQPLADIKTELGQLINAAAAENKDYIVLSDDLKQRFLSKYPLAEMYVKNGQFPIAVAKDFCNNIINKDMNLSVDGITQTQTQIDTVTLPNAKAAIDSANNLSQLDMVEMQSLTDKRGQAYEMASNLFMKLAHAIEAIINNMH